MAEARGPHPRRSAGLIALAALLGGTIGFAVRPLVAPPPAAPPASAAPAAEPPTLPRPPPPLERAELIAAAAAAADAYAAGRATDAAASALVGRDFVLRLPAGCAAGLTSSSPSLTLDAARRTLKLVAAPQDWTQAPWLKTLIGSRPIDAAEGFWLSRPWTASEACPPPATPPDAATPPQIAPASTLGVVQLFEPGGSRALQRAGRPYEVTRRLEADEPLPAAGAVTFRLSGRIAGFDDDQPVRCLAPSPAARPTCLIAVVVDSAAFVDSAGETLAEWRS